MNSKKILLFLFIDFILMSILLIPVRVPEKETGIFNENRLLVEYQQTTGTSLYTIIKNTKELKSKGYSTSILVSGSRPNNWMEVDELASHRFILHGEFKGKDKEGNSIFHVKRWAPTEYTPVVMCYQAYVYVFIVLQLTFDVLLFLLIYYLFKRKGS